MMPSTHFACNPIQCVFFLLPRQTLNFCKRPGETVLTTQATRSFVSRS
jgi:hypothetical protein